MLHLSALADVFTTSYRHGVNARFGLLPEQLAERNARGIVCLTVNAYGHSGPWAKRPGFDQNGQVATGFAVREGLPGKPRFSPVFYLADLITGYLAAAGMMAALLRRSIEGGSYHVKLSLARSAMWVQEMGLLDVSVQGELPSNDNYPAKLVAIQTPYGSVAGLQPPLQFSAMKLPAAEKLEPYGASAATWLDRQY
jgi:crotonobetainyl-CoA:carnitine CoA-transferase CaiB-like acyl-CoA transferase